MGLFRLLLLAIVGKTLVALTRPQIKRIRKRGKKVKMMPSVLKVDGSKVSIAQFKRTAKKISPTKNKALIKNGRIIAVYSAKARSVIVIKGKSKKNNTWL